MVKDSFNYDRGERELLSNILNEVLHGFRVDDFEAVIGMERAGLDRLMTYLTESLSDATVDFSLDHLRVLRNALRESLTELGPEEFHTRTGALYDRGESLLNRLNEQIEWYNQYDLC